MSPLRVLIATLWIVTVATSSSGCATVVAHGFMSENSKVARGIPVNFAGSYVDATFAWGSLLDGDGLVRLMFLPLLLDLPLSFFADVLILPWTATR